MKNKTDTLQGGHTDVMKELVRKELFLSTPRPLYLFCFLSALLLIPAYPAVVGVGYCFLAVFIACNYQRANRDIEFTAALPVKRSDIVVGKAVLVMAFQLLQLAVAAAAAAAADYLIYPDGNIVGMDPHLAFFGIVLIGFGAFTVVFRPGYFSTGYKAGAPVLFGLAAFLAVYGAAETTVQLIPAVRSALDTLDAGALYIRVAVFVLGAAVYAAAVFSGVKLAQKKFDKVSL